MHPLIPSCKNQKHVDTTSVQDIIALDIRFGGVVDFVGRCKNISLEYMISLGNVVSRVTIYFRYRMHADKILHMHPLAPNLYKVDYERLTRRWSHPPIFDMPSPLMSLHTSSDKFPFNSHITMAKCFQHFVLCKLLAQSYKPWTHSVETYFPMPSISCHKYGSQAAIA